MRSPCVAVVIITMLIFAVSCEKSGINELSDVSASGSFIVSSEISENGELMKVIEDIIGEKIEPVFKENSMIGDDLVTVFSVGDTLFACAGEDKYFIDKNGWRNVGYAPEGYYIGHSAVITHTEDEYIIFVSSLCDDLLGKAGRRQITRSGEKIISGQLLFEYSITQRSETVKIAVNDTLQVAFVDNGSGEYAEFNGDISKYQANG